MKIPCVQFICILSEFIEAYLAALLCNLFCISVFIPKLSGDPAVSGLSARLMSVYWARTRAEEPGSGELRPGLRVRWSLSPIVLSGLQNHFVGVYPRAHCCCSDILAPILFDFCISLITQNLERNNEENSHILYFEHFSDHSPGILTPNQWSLFRI